MWQSFDETYHDRRFPELSCWLTGADRTRKEVVLNHLNPKDRSLFDVAMKKEWDNWKAFDAVSIVDEKDIDKDTPRITTRWIHTDKHSIDTACGSVLIETD